MTLPAVLTRWFHPVLTSRALHDEPVGVTVDGAPLVLWRDQRGQPACLVDACAHRRAPLSAGRVTDDGRIACGYHGWSYDREGAGRSPSQPGLRRISVPALQAVEHRGLVWVAAQGVGRDTIPDLQWPGFRLAHAATVPFDAPLELVLDNFSEDEHFPWVHEGLGWGADDLEALQCHIETGDRHSEVTYRGVQRRVPFMRVAGLSPGDRFENHWVTRFEPLHTVFTFRWWDAAGTRERRVVTRSAVFLVPETETRTQLHVAVFVKISSRRLRLVRPLVHWLARTTGLREIEHDAAICGRMKHVDPTLKGMRLDRYDAAVIHNRKLLDRIYRAGDTADRLRPGSRTSR